jgi:hypothetical protein
LRITRLILPGIAALALAGASDASAAGGTGIASKAPSRTSAATASTGGAGIAGPATPQSTPAHPIVYGSRARIIHGVAYAPSFAPLQVQRAIWAGNKIRHKPYIYGGGHGVWNDAGYDCSGSVSYVLHAAGLLSVSMDSSEFESWGSAGRGQWITIYTNPAHAFIEIAGIRFDTSAEGDPNPPPGSGPRWRPLLQDTGGFAARHPGAL